MSATTMTNGKPRKQLSEQLDRLDSIIDALAEGLPGAVVDACKEGARTAVKEAIVEVLTNPELRALTAPLPVPTTVPETAPEPTRPGVWQTLKDRLAAAKNAVATVASRAKNAVVGRCRAARETLSAVGSAAGEALPLRRIVLVGLGVGLTVGIACLLMPQTVAATVGAVSATATTIAVQTGRWLKRAARRVGLLS